MVDNGAERDCSAKGSSRRGGFGQMDKEWPTRRVGQTDKGWPTDAWACRSFCGKASSQFRGRRVEHIHMTGLRQHFRTGAHVGAHREHKTTSPRGTKPWGDGRIVRVVLRVAVARLRERRGGADRRGSCDTARPICCGRAARRGPYGGPSGCGRCRRCAAR